MHDHYIIHLFEIWMFFALTEYKSFKNIIYVLDKNLNAT